MAPGRNSGVMTGFILSGFSEHPELKIVLFVLFLGIFFTALAWTPALIILTSMESHLHSPKYFFLGNLSFVHISYASSIVPKTLCDFVKEQKTVSCVGCASQFFFFSGMGGSVVSWQLWHKTNTLQPSALHSPHGPHPPTLEDSSHWTGPNWLYILAPLLWAHESLTTSSATCHPCWSCLVLIPSSAR